MINIRFLICLVASLSFSNIFVHSTHAAGARTTNPNITQLDALLNKLREDYKVLTKTLSEADRKTPRQTFSTDMTELTTYVGANPSAQADRAQKEANTLQGKVEVLDVRAIFAPLQTQYAAMMKANKSQPSPDHLFGLLHKAVSNKMIEEKSLEQKAAQDLWSVISARRKDITNLKGLIPQPSNSASPSAQKLFNQLLAQYNKIIDTASQHLDNIDARARTLSQDYIAISSGNSNGVQSLVPPLQPVGQ